MLIRLPDLSDERGINAISNVRTSKFRRFPVDNLRQTLPALVSAFLETAESPELQFLPSMFPSRQPSILCSHLFFCSLRGRKKTNGIYFNILSCRFSFLSTRYCTHFHTIQMPVGVLKKNTFDLSYFCHKVSLRRSRTTVSQLKSHQNKLHRMLNVNI